MKPKYKTHKKKRTIIQDKNPIRYPHKFKSRWEEKVWKWLPKKKSKYETLKLPYSTSRTYIPDFIIERPGYPDLILEAKGYLRPSDRSKMIQVKEAHPDLDIRFVFAYNNKLNKNSKTTYVDWATKNGFPSSVGKIPNCWIYPSKRDKEYSDNYYKNNREKILEKEFLHKLKTRYGITFEEYQSMKNTQNNCCAICRTSFDILPRRPDVDHCHQTGKVRGLLCWQCNGGLGQFKDDPTLFRLAAEYLERFQ